MINLWSSLMKNFNTQKPFLRFFFLKSFPTWFGQVVDWMVASFDEFLVCVFLFFKMLSSLCTVYGFIKRTGLQLSVLKFGESVLLTKKIFFISIYTIKIRTVLDFHLKSLKMSGGWSFKLMV